MRPLTPILYVHHERALGGAPLSLLFLLQSLDQTRYSPHILCLREGSAADLFRRHKFPVQILEGPDLSHTELVWFQWWRMPKLGFFLLRSIPLYFRLRRAFLTACRDASGKPVAPAVIHLNSSTLAIAALAAKSVGIPVVWHVREPLAHGYFGLRRAILRAIFRHCASHVIAISQNDAHRLGHFPPERLSVIHNFVDFTYFDKKRPAGVLRKERGIPAEASIILFLGGSTKVKGVDTLLKAAPNILKALPSSHLIIAGEMDHNFQLEVEIPKFAPYRHRLHLLGPRHDIPELLADATLLVFPAKVPHFARPIIEAAAMSKAVIASDLDGMRELVIPNETGILIPAKNPKALTRSIIELLNDPQRLFRLGEQAHAMALEKFDSHKNSRATFAIYEKFLT